MEKSIENKNIMKVTQEQFTNLVKKMVTESVKRILNEDGYDVNNIQTPINPKYIKKNNPEMSDDKCEKAADYYYNHYLEETDKNINEAENGGWVVDSSEAQEAYNLFVNAIGEAEANAAIVRALGDNALSEVLAYLFRMYNFREWKSKFD